MMTPKTVYLKDYTQPTYLIDQTTLHFELDEEITLVKSILQLRRDVNATTKELVLNGEGLELKSIAINGEPLTANHYLVTAENLIIKDAPETFILETVVAIKPQENKRLEGLFKTQKTFCTQCEPHGFRRITYFIDRPDVLTHFTVTITADKTSYPVLLANGNLLETKDLGDGRHWVKWEDPSLKPCYLFALVAGDLAHVAGSFTTMSGRQVQLYVYVEHGKKDQAHYALASLIRAMRWDEETFGREYDLDIYMIVAVSDFNMGAMENKGLNIFNDKYVLAKPETATDDDFINIESVIGHEYFHNWTGNRVTCRDWFQLTLKEGLTIFRDENFTADLHSPAVKRIQDARIIRTVQFAQDAGPMSHPIRPASFVEINNFYTVTVYNKGAEVIRMIETIIGKDLFRKGMDLYFSRHDGHAVTTDEFVQAMADVSNIDFTQFKNWYNQSGTPIVDISSHYDAEKNSYTLTIKQSCPATADQTEKNPFVIPITLGLLASKGEAFSLQLEGEMQAHGTERVLIVDRPQQSFNFINVPDKPIPSLGRNFSAPVKINYPYSDAELIFIMVHDKDGYNRWDASQVLFTRVILQLIKDYHSQKEWILDSQVVQAFEQVLNDTQLDKSLAAEILTLPSVAYLINEMTIADIEVIHYAREFVKVELARLLREHLLAVYRNYHDSGAYQLTAEAMNRRQLKNLCLYYLLHYDMASARELALEQFQTANNMTDAMGALLALNNVEGSEREIALNDFYQRWQHESLVIDKWFSLQAVSSLPGTLNHVKALLMHPAYDATNPNKVRALVGAFAVNNHVHFHDISGAGYIFLADQILAVDDFNPQLAARLIEPFTRLHKFDQQRQQLIKAQLQRILDKPKLSKDVYEIVVRSL